MENPFFYNDLAKHKASIQVILAQPEAFKKIPADWHIIITDIKDSTKAVNEGLSELVNLIATGSIIAALNIAAESKIDIPFFFGGDGATIVVPSVLLQETVDALVLHQSNVREKFNIDLRVGSLPVSKVYKEQKELKIAKVGMNSLFAIPIILGNGLQFTESHIKANYVSPKKSQKDKVELKLDGMECRWNKIPPPNLSDEVVCLLVDASNQYDQATIFKNVLDKIETIYGSHQNRNPISISKLQLNTRLTKIKTELSTRSQNYSIKELLVNWIYTVIGKIWYMPSKSGQKYLNELVQLSDIFVMDGRINMVISGHSEKTKLLVDFLEEEERKGRLIFGIHLSQESIISCYVRNRKADHIHFVDGGKGGYNQAATLLKSKIKALKSEQKHN